MIIRQRHPPKFPGAIPALSIVLTHTFTVKWVSPVRAPFLAITTYCPFSLCLKEYSREVLAQESADFTQGPLMSSCKHF